MALGRDDPEVMLTTMSWRQFRGWLAFYSLDPWGEQRADLRSGIVASTMANLWRSKQSRVFDARDFMPYPEDARAAKPEPTPEQLCRKLSAWASMLPRSK